MNFFDRLKNGWRYGTTSLQVIKENKSLLLFPVFSSISLILIAVVVLGGVFAAFGFDVENIFPEEATGNETLAYGGLFIYYLINYFVIVFFNVGLVHCARQIFNGENTSVSEGINFAKTKLKSIFSWALFAATVGVILKVIEDRLGRIGQIIVGLLGLAWSIATFFVVPILAYEEVSPWEAIKRSGTMMREKWGETVGANFSFGLFFIIGYFAIGLLVFLLFAVHPIVAIVSAVLLALLLHTVIAASKTVFLAAVYNNMTDKPAGRFDQDGLLDDLFVPKRR